MLEYDFEESVACWVVMTARAFEQALNDELAPLGITYRQWQVLGWLAFDGALSQGELAERLRVEAPTLVGILDRMERDGWILREGSPRDRRKKVIRPTAKVQPVWAKIAAAARRVRGRAMRGLGPVKLRTLKGCLETMRRNVAAKSRSAAAG